jgi:DNA repair protein RecN (Recombination protein N)
MLEELHVKNIGGIQQADLHLHGSFIAITGESGAGKSSLIRALELASGKRAQASLIRAGNDEAEVHAILVPDSAFDNLDEDFEVQEGILVVRRVLSRTGRTKTYIQDRPVSLSSLQNVMNPYIGIQSQFAQLDLLEPLRQLNLLDARGGPEMTRLREHMREMVSSAVKKEKEYVALVKRRKEIEDRYEGAEDILSRIRSLHLDEECEQQWEESLRDMQQKITRSGKIGSIYDELTGGHAGEGLKNRLETLVYELKNIVESEEKEEVERLTEGLADGLKRLEDLCEKYLQSDDPQKLQESFAGLERRLGLLRKLKRLTRSQTVADLIAYESQATRDLEWLKNSREKLHSLKEECSSLRKEVTRLALELRKARQEAAGSLEQSVNRVLGDLGMETYRFGVEVRSAEKVRHHGADDVEFYLSDGASLKDAVAKVASGGELSRILLALQCASPRELLPPVLVFDEVEAGLGGKAAMLSGYKLRELSADCQVILVTHEASIAALADQHFKVERTKDVTSVVEVSGEERVVEIARMLAGDHEAPEALVHARSLVGDGGK